MILLPPEDTLEIDFMSKMSCAWLFYKEGDDTNAATEAIWNLHENNEIDMLLFVNQEPILLMRQLSRKMPLLFSKVITMIPLPKGDRELGIPLRFDTLIYFYQDIETGYLLYETYSIKGMNAVKPKIGSWTEATGISMSSSFIWNRRANFFGTELINGVLNGYQFLTAVEYDSDGNISKISGLCHTNFKNFSHMLS